MTAPPAVRVHQVWADNDRRAAGRKVRVVEVDDTLAAIDDVIAWHGSSDAMVWTNDPPKPLTLPDFPRLQVDPDAMRRAGEMMAAQVQAFVDAVRPVAEQMIRVVAAAGRAFAALAATPQMRDLSEARRASRRAMKSEYHRRGKGGRR